jgi:diguanylate cyclase (GGDEF)-like protein/PAS domain S-box-containing protein
MGSDDLQSINERLSLALQSGRQVAFVWLVSLDSFIFTSELPDNFKSVPLDKVTSPAALGKLIHQDDKPPFLAEVRRALKELAPDAGAIHHVEIRLRDASKEWLWTALYGKIVERDSTGRAIRAVGILTDISARKIAEQRIVKLRDMYSALSQTNQAILHIHSREALFNEICRIAVEHGKFDMATIRLLDPSSQRLNLIASGGKNIEFFKTAEVSVDPDKEYGSGPSGTAFRGNRPSICNDIFSTSYPQPWKDAAREIGLHSFAAFPFHRQQQPIGVLTLHSTHKDFFDKPLIDLLVEMTQEISFALDNFDQEAKRASIELALAESEKFKDAILAASLDCIVSFDEEGRIIDFNPAAERTFGYRRSDMLGKPLAEVIIAPESREQYRQSLVQLLITGDSPMLNRRVELMAMHLGGMPFPVEIAIASIDLRDKHVFTAYMRNIAELKQSQAILKDSEARYRQLIDLSPEAILVLQKGRFVLLNEASVRLLGANTVSELLGKNVLSFIHPDHREKGIRRARQLPMGVLRTAYVDEMWLRVDGTSFYAEVAASKFSYMGSAAIQLVIRDITARRLAEELQMAQNRILSMIASGTALPDILTTLCEFIEAQSGRGICAIQLVDTSGTKLLAGAAPSLPARFMHAINDTEVGPQYCSFGAAVFRNDAVMVEDIAVHPLWEPCRDSALAHGLHACSSWPILGKNNKVLGALSMYYREGTLPNAKELQIIDISINLAGIAIENKESEDRIHHLAHYDELTSLPNRSLFNQILNHAMKTAQRNREKIAVLFVDLDRFKNINDALGHDAGDQALQEISKRMLHCIRASDTVARMGGDEFYILLEELVDGQHVAAIAEKILIETSRPFYIDQQECQLSASIGIAIYPDDGADALTLLKNSDIAMYRAKSGSKNAYQFYSASKNIHTLERFALESQLRRAVDNQEFVLHYQPKVELASGRITGVEALVRWQHPEHGLVLPAHFIPLAEEANLITPLGKQILQMACRDALTMNAQSSQPIRVAVNLSARQFDDSEFLNDIKKLLAETGLDTDFLQLEITESMVMHHPEQAVRTMKELQAMGIRLDIDDFGTGYSSLAYLKRFPVYSLKIDRSFIQDIPGGPNDTAITKAIIAMGHSMGMRVIAEGVETAEQADALRRFGCDEYQGFYFSEALPIENVLALIAKQLAQL